MPEQMSAALAAAVSVSRQKAPPPDKLDRVREAVRRYRDLEVEAEDLAERQKAVAKAIQDMRHQELPDLFDEAGVPLLGLAPEGNLPGYTAEVKPFYRANIAAEWDVERRDAGFASLVEQGAGDLVKVNVVVEFGRQERNMALELVEVVRKAGYEPKVEQAVAWNTLTAWLKEQVETHHRVPPLEPIGGHVGREVRLKKVKT